MRNEYDTGLDLVGRQTVVSPWCSSLKLALFYCFFPPPRFLRPIQFHLRPIKNIGITSWAGETKLGSDGTFVDFHDDRVPGRVAQYGTRTNPVCPQC